jgi:vacuolar-type H+-ATPase subunit E/Vma4
VVETQFQNARIMSAEMKFNMVIANLEEQYTKQVEDILLNLPATGRYELLKKKLIKRMANLKHKRI